MAFTVRLPVYGTKPPCAYPSRLDDRRQIIKNKLMERTRKAEKQEDFVVYRSSDDEDEEEYSNFTSHRILFSSNNFADYIRAREYASKEYHTVDINYGTRHILSHDMLKERPISLGSEVNKIFCSAWLSHRQVVFGTKCNKLMVYDVITKAIDQIPCIVGTNEDSGPEEQCGIHALTINPSRSLLATGGRNSNEVGIYKLPTLDPVYIGENAHDDWIFDIVWFDDQYFATCSRDTKVALWRIPELEPEDTEIPLYSSINPVVIRKCKAAQKVRAFAFDKQLSELAALSVNGFVHIWDVERFKQTISSKLPSSQEPVCMSVNDEGSLYAIGCRSYTLLIDTRSLQLVKKIQTRYNGVRSTSFKSDLLTLGSGVGIVMFYDLRIHRYLESGVNSSRTVTLKTSKGYISSEEEYLDHNPLAMNNRYTPAVYTHCYDSSGLRLFCAGGPLSVNTFGNYASIWQ